jgi:hypothetical protein
VQALKGYILSEQNCSQIKKDTVACFEFTAVPSRTLERRGRQQTVPAEIDIVSIAATQTRLPRWVDAVEKGLVIFGEQ